jgi:ABC-type antimicrobial peptide transport system permease subunit
MLGIIIGVASVVTTVSLGEGVRRQVEGQIKHLGSDLVTILPGKDAARSNRGLGLLSAPSGGTFSDQDYNTVKMTRGVKLAVPFSTVNADAKTDDKEFSGGFLIATTDQLPDALNQPVRFGSFFGSDELDKRIVVIGKNVAQDLFGENSPLGKSMLIRGERFVVGGVFAPFDSSPLSPTTDYNSAIFLPYESARNLTSQVQIYQLLVRPVDTKQTQQTVDNITRNLSEAHGKQKDFTVLKQDENLAASNRILNLLTSMIAGIAAISLFVGGIGIMNIMLVSVTERTKEIGVRKAIGATNRQILDQFMTEAAVLSASGGIIGLLVALLADYLFRLFTDIKPAVTWPIMGLALAVAMGVGMLFGIIPAFKAASRDPIEALRYE